MNNEQIKQTPSSGFYGLLRPKRLTIWAYCPVCWERTEQVFHHEGDRFEYYECQKCGQLHEVAVR